MEQQVDETIVRIAIDQDATREQAIELYKREAAALVSPEDLAEIQRGVDAICGLPAITQQDADALGILVVNANGHRTAVAKFWEPMKSGAFTFHRMICAAEKATGDVWDVLMDKSRKKIGAFATEKEQLARQTAADVEQASASKVDELRRQQQELMRSGEVEQAESVAARADAMASAPAMQATEKVTVAGMSLPKIWTGTVTDLDAFLKGILAGTIPREWAGAPVIEVNQSALNKAATAHQNKLHWPGVEVKSEISTRRKSSR